MKKQIRLLYYILKLKKLIDKMIHIFIKKVNIKEK